MITGRTEIVAHIGYPTGAFKAPMVYNPYFEQAGIDAVVVPMAVRAEDYALVLPALFKLGNIRYPDLFKMSDQAFKITTISTNGVNREASFNF